MALKKATLKEKAEENARVTKGTSKNQEVLKEGVPCEHSKKHLASEKIVGVNVGVTLNMEDYNSLRVDCWATDYVGENETHDEAYARVLEVVDSTLQSTIKYYKE